MGRDHKLSQDSIRVIQAVVPADEESYAFFCWYGHHILTLLDQDMVYMVFLPVETLEVVEESDGETLKVRVAD